MTNQVNVKSEIAPLRRVIVHRPDEGISRITPKRAEELLFDDIVHLPKMQEEHDVFTDILKSFLQPENVLEVEQLLEEALSADDDSKQEMIEKVVDYEELPHSFEQVLQQMTNQELAKVLITGYYKEEDHFLFDPIPNFIFTRDIAVTVNDHIIITKASKMARFRENFIIRFIIWAHPIFRRLRKEGRIINLNNVDLFPPSKKGEMVSIEGGDMMILHHEYLLIGASERSTPHGFESLKKVLFEKKVIQNVVLVHVPHERSYMHLDTIFTQIDEKDYVAYKPIIVDGLSSYVEVHNIDGGKKRYPSVKEFIESELTADARFILSGQGETPYQEREQWTDGCNLVALKPGVAITYDRNPKTELAFKSAGYRVVHAPDLLEAFKDGIVLPEEVKKTIITLPSSELSRARGGSHCMTCPIERG